MRVACDRRLVCFARSDSCSFNQTYRDSLSIQRRIVYLDTRKLQNEHFNGLRCKIGFRLKHVFLGVLRVRASDFCTSSLPLEQISCSNVFEVPWYPFAAKHVQAKVTKSRRMPLSGCWNF